MKSLTFKQFAAFLAAGILVTYTVSQAIFALSWFCYVPLFLLLKDKTKKQFFFAGLAFGLGMALVSFSWMIGAAREFSGNYLFYSMLVTTLSALLFALYWGSLMDFLNYCLDRLQQNIWVRAIVVASCFVLGESLLGFCFTQMPYYLFNSGYGLLDNLYTIQWTAYLGLPFLNFLVIFINYLLADIISSKKWGRFIQPIGVVIGIMVIGLLIKLDIEKKVVAHKTTKVAIAAENIPAKLRWDEQGGNILAQRLITLSKQAALLNPDLVLWSESAVPWPYRSNDELLTEILKQSNSSKTAHVIGFMSAHSKERMANSAYSLTADGKVQGRYDKTALLHFIETPIFGLNMPFLDLDGYLIEPGKQNLPLVTPVGKAGIAICNEIIKTEVTTEAVKNGAEFLLNLSNDGWFKDSYIVKLHFLYARLSAVSNRKDMVVNSNHGISGYIKSTGEIVLKRKSKELFVELVNVSLNRYQNAGRYFPNLLPFACLVFVLLVLLKGFLERRRNS